MRPGRELSWAVAFVLAACYGPGGDRPQPSAGAHTVATRVVAATPAECANDGKAVESGVDANDNGALDDGEVSQRTIVCSSDPAGGAPVVIRIDPEPRGAHCPEGGSAVRSGRDANGNGTLEPEESTSVAYACAGRTLTRIVPQPAGNHCTLGGAAIRSGRERNGNGKLDDDEVEATQYVCDAALLTRMAQEPPGAHCVGGGIAFLIGRDRDGDHALSDSEVEWTEYECSDVLSRTVTVRTSADLAALASIKAITGNLTIQSFSITEVSLPALEDIGGSLLVFDNPVLSTLSFPTLTAVHGALTLNGNSSLATLHFEKLQQVDGDFGISQNPKLTDLSGFSSLRTLGAQVLIAQNMALERAETIANDAKGLTIYGNPLLNKFQMNSLTGIDNVVVYDNAALAELDVHISRPFFIDAPLGPVHIHDNPHLVRLSIHAPIIHSLEITKNEALAELDIVTDRVENDTRIWSDTSLKKVTFSPLRYNGSLEFVGALSIEAPLEELYGFDMSTSYGDVSVAGTNLTALKKFFKTVRGSLSLRRNSKLTCADFFSVDGAIDIANNDALQSFSLVVSNESRSSVYISNNEALVDAYGLVGATRFTGSVTITHNANLVRPGIFAATEIDGDLVVTDNPNLKEFNFTQLRTVGGSLNLERNGPSTWVGLGALETVNRRMSVSANPSLTNLDIPRLGRVEEVLRIDNNPALLEIKLPVLQAAGGMLITNNPKLPACFAAQLLSLSAGSKAQSGNDETAICP